MENCNKKIVLVDAYSQIFRAFYAVKSLNNSQGVPTNALHGFIRILMKLDREYASDYGVVVFDCGRVNFRMELNPLYKANRKPTPEELKVQVPMIREFIEAFGWIILEEDQYEADDLIGAIAKEFIGKVLFLSSDKDLSQIINSEVTQLVPDIKSSFAERTPEKVIEKFGVTADLLIDYLALLGDSADNIIGVAGIGVKGAAKILNQYGSLKSILANPEVVTDDKLRQKLVDNSELIYKNIDLITLKTDLPSRLNELDSICKKREMNFEKLFEICQKYELNSITKEIDKLAKQKGFVINKIEKTNNDNSIFDDENSLFFQCENPTVIEPKKSSKKEKEIDYSDDLFGDF